MAFVVSLEENKKQDPEASRPINLAYPPARVINISQKRSTN